MVARVEALPFRDHSFAFAIASHIGEHVDDPAGLCDELRRVAKAGYIETPSPVADLLLHEDYHLWRVGSHRGTLVFTAKGPRGKLEQRWTEPVYKVFYAGQPDASRAVLELPLGHLGEVLRLARRAVAAGLARIGVMHTRHAFGPDRPLVYKVVRPRPRSR